ncbi:adenylyl-sulfate kinase [Ferruginibacter profundus]
MIIQFCGLSGSGKSTLARAAEAELLKQGIETEIIDGDEYRATLCKGLGFSRQDRFENMRRMAFVAHQLSKHGVVVIICAINPYEEIRNEVKTTYPDVLTAFIDCSVETLKIRDTKGLYQKAFLPLHHPDRINNLTGINDPFEDPLAPDIYINTDNETIIHCVNKMVAFVKTNLHKKQTTLLPGYLKSNIPFLNRYINS